VGSNLSTRDAKTKNGRKLSMTKKQMRARARRAARIIELEEKENELHKPIQQWDLDELAKGRPRNKNGNFAGAAPKYVSRATHETIVKEFAERAKGEIRLHAVKALKAIADILENDEVDANGKPLVSAGIKLQAATFVVEHALGKPTQRIEGDVSVRLQGILAAATAQPELPKDLFTGALDAASSPLPAATRAKVRDQGSNKKHKVSVTVPGRLPAADEDDDAEDFGDG